MSETLTQAEIAAAAEEFTSAAIDDSTFVLEREGERLELLQFDDDDRIARVLFRADMDPFLDHCAKAREVGIDRKSEFRRIASLPIDFLLVWGAQQGITDPAWYLKPEYTDLVVDAAHDRDAAKFRTLEGEYRRRA